MRIVGEHKNAAAFALFPPDPHDVPSHGCIANIDDLVSVGRHRRAWLLRCDVEAQHLIEPGGDYQPLHGPVVL